MNVEFLPEAVADIDRLYDFLVRADPLAAQKAMLVLDEGILLLRDSPEMGIGLAGNAELRELYVPFGRSAYVLRYRIDRERQILIVVRVWHGREGRAT
ncbi:MAG: type II toxin-antitoxin system RelE/ParE family toxin [Alphaproteobacteria bacterium]|nr:type II toxin-antitoxin system RelE/ParE family toxin [Alphaproteobacteria bacterium]